MKKQLQRIITPLLVGAITYFFYITLQKNWHSIQQEGVSFAINWESIFAMMLFALAVVVSGVLWGRVLATVANKKISFQDAVRIHAASWLLKYVPGQVGSVINKTVWGSKRGISKKTSLTAFLYENILMVMAGGILSLPALILFSSRLADSFSLILPLVALIPMALVFYKPFFYKLLNATLSFLKKNPFKESDFLSSRQLFRFQVGYLFPRFLNGVGFVFIAQSLLPHSVDPSIYIGLGSIYILAGAVGLLAIFVPGGIGVREAVIVLFASAYVPTEQAIILSVIARLYATLADIIVALIYIILNKGRLKQI